MEIVMNNIDKSFALVKVLNAAEFHLKNAEIHALMGENGAGKSTLMNILTGVHQKDSGEIFIDGNPVSFKHPKLAEEQGIVFIHQELNTMPDLTVEENIFMGKEIKKFGIVDQKAMRKQITSAFKKLGVNINPSTIMSALSVGQQQLVEIAKALMIEAKVIIMDEPTAALTLTEIENLFRIARSLKEQGVSIVYISHRMEEIFQLCDRITVLRDGSYVGTENIADTSMEDIVKMMIGRELGDHYPERQSEIGDVAFEVNGLSKTGVFNDINFFVRKGEVLGVAGLMGAGRTEIMQAIFGSIKPITGDIIINGHKVKIANPLEARKNKIGFITEDRKLEGLILSDSVRQNISLTNLDKVSLANVVMSSSKEKTLASEGLEKFNIKASSYNQTVGTLSGGNQQKVVFAKWVFTDPEILILDEPTRGVDVGAKKEIYTIINQLAKSGVAIIMISSDLPEILGMSDRILVIHEGKGAGVLDIKDADQEKVMTLATGGTV